MSVYRPLPVFPPHQPQPYRRPVPGTTSGALTAGSASTSSVGTTTATVTSTDATGGTAPYTYQWQRSLTSGSGFSNVGGATSLTLNDTGLTDGTTYYYRLVFTDSASASVTSNETVAKTYTAVTNSNLFFSPYNWYSDGGGALAANNIKGSSTYALSNTPGAYFKFKVTSTGSGSVKVNLDTTSLSGLTGANCPTLQWSKDGGAFSTQLTAYSASAVQYTLATGLASGTHEFIVHFKSIGIGSGSGSTGDRWTTPENAVKVTGLELDSGSTMASQTARSKNLIVYGDSITEGADSVGSFNLNADQDASATFTAFAAYALGCEYGIVGFSGSGYTGTGYGNVPALTTSYSLYFNGASRLVSGALSPAPDYIVVADGRNDSDGAGTVTAVGAVQSDLRTAAPSARIFFMVTPDGTCRTSVTSGVTTDSTTFLIDQGSANDSAAIGRNSNDGIHPNARGHAEDGAWLAKQVQATLAAGGGSGGTASVFSSGIIGSVA